MAALCHWSLGWPLKFEMFTFQHNLVLIPFKHRSLNRPRDRFMPMYCLRSYVLCSQVAPHFAIDMRKPDIFRCYCSHSLSRSLQST
jgi:hypothetical protein